MDAVISLSIGRPETTQAVNRGVPVILDKPRSAAALALGHIADSFLGVEAQEAEPATENEPRRRAWRRTDKEASGP